MVGRVVRRETCMAGPRVLRDRLTGMLTSEKTDFAITYIDPESNTLRSYYA